MTRLISTVPNPRQPISGCSLSPEWHTTHEHPSPDRTCRERSHRTSRNRSTIPEATSRTVPARARDAKHLPFAETSSSVHIQALGLVHSPIDGVPSVFSETHPRSLASPPWSSPRPSWLKHQRRQPSSGLVVDGVGAAVGHANVAIHSSDNKVNRNTLTDACRTLHHRRSHRHAL